MIVNDKEFYNKINTIQIDYERYVIENTISNKDTLIINGIFIHSMFNPEGQGEIFAEQNYSEQNDLFLYGVGLGYHIIALYNKLKGSQRLYILETDYLAVKLALDINKSLKSVLQSPKVLFMCSDDINKINGFIESINTKTHTIYYEPSLRQMPQHLRILKKWFENFKIDLNSSRFNKKMNENHNKNIRYNYPNFISLFACQFKNIPCTLISSGPSTEEKKYLLKSIRKSSLVFSAGRNTKYLSKAELLPDAWFEIDPQDLVGERYRNLNNTVPLVFLSTVSEMAVKEYKGDKAVLLSEERSETDFIASGYSTVSATMLEAAVRLGCNPIILIGQDLCYINKSSHVNEKNNLIVTDITPKILCNDGNVRYTNNSFLRHKESIEKIVESYPGVDIYTTSYRGVKLKGIRYITDNEIVMLTQKTINKEEFFKQINKNQP